MMFYYSEKRTFCTFSVVSLPLSIGWHEATLVLLYFNDRVKNILMIKSVLAFNFTDSKKKNTGEE